MDNSAKGIIAGLTMDTSKEKIYQGIMEGCSYEMKLNLDYLQKAGIAVEKLFATGGGANSKEWLHIKADIYDKEIISLGAAESGTVACICLPELHVEDSEIWKKRQKYLSLIEILISHEKA